MTPTTPGHVFERLENGAAPGSGRFTNLNVESGTSAFPTPTDGDLPVSDIVRDDSTRRYTSRRTSASFVATTTGRAAGSRAGMPRYEVMHLEIQPSSRVATCADAPECKAMSTQRRTRRASGTSSSTTRSPPPGQTEGRPSGGPLRMKIYRCEAALPRTAGALTAPSTAPVDPIAGERLRDEARRFHLVDEGA